MSKRVFLAALAEARAGRVQEAAAQLATLAPQFVVKRLRHYESQPDHRETVARLRPVWESVRGGRLGVVSEQEPQARPDPFGQAPLAPLTVSQAPGPDIDFDHPEPFLGWTTGDWSRLPPLALDDLRHVEPWALVGLAALCLQDRPRSPPVRLGDVGGASRFAHSLGFHALCGGTPPSYNLPERTVQLTRVRLASESEPTAERMAMLIFGRGLHTDDARLAVRYVLVELLRNVIQHSQDPLGAVAAAQWMGQAQRRQTPMVQLAVADAGIGVPRSLQRAHPHLADYRQALERALLPHISGTFAEGETGSFENAGLGLYMISEMARQTRGRLLLASSGASLVLQQTSGTEPATPRFLLPAGVGFPGTLVSFEIPAGSVEDYHGLIKELLRKAAERTPKRAPGRWLKFEPAPEGSERVALSDARENTVLAAEIARTRLRPALVEQRAVELDFGGLELCTQSWLHALLFEATRLGWALKVPIYVIHADPAVQEGLRVLEAYALGG